MSCGRATVGRTPLQEWSSPSQRPLPDKTQHSQQTNIQALGGIRTHDRRRRAAKDLRLRPRGHWDLLQNSTILLFLSLSHTHCDVKRYVQQIQPFNLPALSLNLQAYILKYSLLPARPRDVQLSLVFGKEKTQPVWHTECLVSSSRDTTTLWWQERTHCRLYRSVLGCVTVGTHCRLYRSVLGCVTVGTHITATCDVSDSTTVHLFPGSFLFVDTVKSDLT